MEDRRVADGLDLIVVRSGGSVDLTVLGEIDLVTVDRFGQALKSAVSEAPGVVNLDLSAVTFMGSEGISALIQVRKLADSKGVTFRIMSASARVESVLDLAGLAGYFD